MSRVLWRRGGDVSLRAAAIARTRLAVVTSQVGERDRERGDVPGWVMVTLMTAGLVALVYGLASEAIGDVLADAFDGILGSDD